MIKVCFLSLFLSVLLLIACSENRKMTDTVVAEKTSPFLFRMNNFATEAELDLSFPLWYNDSIIKERGIRTMVRAFYRIDLDDSSSSEDLTYNVPLEVRRYSFGEQGALNEIRIMHYYDDQEIGGQQFWYTTTPDKYGYADVVGQEEVSDRVDGDAERPDTRFKTHKKLVYKDKFLAYQDEESGDYLFFLFKRDFWGPLSVDSILHPSPQDEIVLGTPGTFFKRYQVRNKVREKNVTRVIYDPSSRRVQRVISHEHPFDTYRSVQYDKKGLCKGYIDSTFSGSKFLSREVVRFELDPTGLPIRITCRKESSYTKTGQISAQIITYDKK